MADVFRRQYRPLTDDEKKRNDAIKAKAEELHELLTVGGRDAPGAREMACARTALEESVMWATKAITS